MSKNKVINLISTDEIQQKLEFERFRLEFRHEYIMGGNTVKIDDTLVAECVMPLDEPFGLPIYNKQEILRWLWEKLSEDMRGEQDKRGNNQ